MRLLIARILPTRPLTQGALFLAGLVLAGGCAHLPGRRTLPEGPTSAATAANSKSAKDGLLTGPQAKFNDLAKARNYLNNGQLDKARTIYERVRKRSPKDPEAYHRLGVIADKQRRHGDAQQFYTRAIQLSKPNAELFNDLGYCFYLQGQLNKAESALRKAVRLGDEPRYHNNLGMILGHQDRYPEALDQFAQAGSKADAYYNLAFVYASQEKDKQALMCFRQALAINPKHQPSRDALQSFAEFESRPSLDPDGQLADAPDGYVPFVEDAGGVGAADGAGAVQQVSHDSQLTPPRQAGSLSRVLHNRAQQLLQRHMASERKDEAAP